MEMTLTYEYSDNNLWTPSRKVMALYATRFDEALWMDHDVMLVGRKPALEASLCSHAPSNVLRQDVGVDHFAGYC